jgi:hypothetical protein
MEKDAAVAVLYFRPDGVPGRYFECAHYGVMSVGACARNFSAAPESAKTGRLQRCVGCAIGRKHAGTVLDEPVSARVATSVVYRIACVRCRRDGKHSGTRLIGRLRLVRGHTICVSCFNREAEVRRGANSKGARPKKWAGLFSTRAAYVASAKAVVLTHPSPVVDRIELALTLIRCGHDSGIVWARSVVQRDIEAKG